MAQQEPQKRYFEKFFENLMLIVKQVTNHDGTELEPCSLVYFQYTFRNKMSKCTY